MKLEKATRKVAEGDLDFELPSNDKDEIASLTKSFDYMRKELKKARSRRSRFLLGVSHDLKTPLTSIKGYLEAISDGLASDPFKLERYLEVINEKSEVLEERIAELIDYVQMETGEWRMKFEDVKLSRFLKGLSELYREDASVFNRKFHSRVNIPESIIVKSDKALLIRCFENLFNNAIRYTEECDLISFYTELNDGPVIIKEEFLNLSIEEQRQGENRGADSVFP